MDKSWKPVIAGVLDIVSGVFALWGVALMVFMTTPLVIGLMMDAYAASPSYIYVPTPDMFVGIFTAIAVFLAIVAALNIGGGICAVVRKRWGLALSGSIAAIFSAFPLGVLATILVVVSQKEFGRSSGQGPSSAT